MIADYLSDLNEKQYEAVTCTDGPLLALAGAGTGKTKMLTARIAYILEKNLCDPHNILAVTFTNKAAKEMESRIMSLIDCTGLWLGTFHSIAARILRKHANLIGLESNFSIIDSTDQIKLIKSFSSSKEIDPKIILSIINKWKDKSLLPHEINDTLKDIDKYSKDIYIKYQDQLLQSNAVDFGDLLLYNNQIFAKFSDVLDVYQRLFRYILVDEYQDTNIAQYNWIKSLSAISRNICCVGDDDQSIYGWRGAEIGNILRFHQDFTDAKIIKLEQNYRSTKQILTAASGLIGNNSRRHDKLLWTTASDGDLVNIVSCFDDKEEARFVANKIENTKTKYRPSDIAILVRAGFQTRAFEDVFITKQIPYQIVGNLKFYERAEIKDAIAYIRLVMNNNDNLAFERIINKPKRSIGAVTVQNIALYASENNVSMFYAVELMLQERKLKSPKIFENFILNIKKWPLLYSTSSNYDATKKILEESGYLESLTIEKTEENIAKRDNIYELLRAIGEYKNIGEFLEHTSLISGTNIDDNSEAVKLMTIHASKGLEFELVFLPGWEEDIFPSARCIIGAEGKKGLEEERRIAYVGITRAKQELFISYAKRRQLYYEYVTSTPSRFLHEIPRAVINLTSSVETTHSYAKQVQYISQPTISKFVIGDIVQHKQFGTGSVKLVSGDFVEIYFAELNHSKLIHHKFLTICKVEG